MLQNDFTTLELVDNKIISINTTESGIMFCDLELGLSSLTDACEVFSLSCNNINTWEEGVADNFFSSITIYVMNTEYHIDLFFNAESVLYRINIGTDYY